MIIHGLGVDIVDIRRFKSIAKRNKSFINRIFSKIEKNYCNKNINKFNCYSKRFAAKEAFSKALGTGIRNQISFKEIEIFNDQLGKPNVQLKGKSLLLMNKILKRKNYKIYLSISDETFFAVANVIIVIKK